MTCHVSQQLQFKNRRDSAAGAELICRNRILETETVGSTWSTMNTTVSSQQGQGRAGQGRAGQGLLGV